MCKSFYFLLLKMFRIITFIFVFTVNSIYCATPNDTSAQWQTVFAKTFSSIPIPNDSAEANEPVQVLVDASVLDIEGINGVRMEMMVHLLLRQYWKDSSFDITNGTPPAQTIWIPDTKIANQRSINTQNGDEQFTLKYNRKTQELEKSERILAMVKCDSMDFTSYPFDYHTCNLYLKSVFHTQQRVAYKWDRNYGEGERGFDAGEHAVKKYEIVLPFQIMQVSMHQVNWTNSSASAQLSLGIEVRRLWSAYVRRFYLPMTTFVATSLLSLWLVHPKISFVVNFANIVSMNIFLAIWDLHSDIPKLSYCTALDAYSMICFVFIVLILILNVYILFYIKSEENDSDDGHNQSALSSQEHKYFLPKQDENRSFRIRHAHPHPYQRTVHSRTSTPTPGLESGQHQQVDVAESPVLEAIPGRKSKDNWSIYREIFLDKMRRSGHTLFLFTFIAIFFLYWIILLSIYYS